MLCMLCECMLLSIFLALNLWKLPGTNLGPLVPPNPVQGRIHEAGNIWQQS